MPCLAHHQGEKEVEAGLPMSTFYDRANPSVAKMQTGFIGFIVKPIFSVRARRNLAPRWPRDGSLGRTLPRSRS